MLGASGNMSHSSGLHQQPPGSQTEAPVSLLHDLVPSHLPQPPAFLLNGQAKRTVLQARQSFIKNDFRLKRSFKSFCNDDRIICIMLYYATGDKSSTEQVAKMLSPADPQLCGQLPLPHSPARLRWGWA